MLRRHVFANPRLATIAFWTRIGYGARPDPLPEYATDAERHAADNRRRVRQSLADAKQLARKRDNYAWICDSCAPSGVELKTLGSDGPCAVCGKRAPCMLCPKDKLPEPLSAAQRWAQAELDCLLFGKAEVSL